MLGEEGKVNCVKKGGLEHSHITWVIDATQNTKPLVVCVDKIITTLSTVSILLPANIYFVAKENQQQQNYVAMFLAFSLKDILECPLCNGLKCNQYILIISIWVRK